jgi:hypothetical protein
MKNTSWLRLVFCLSAILVFRVNAESNLAESVPNTPAAADSDRDAALVSLEILIDHQAFMKPDGRARMQELVSALSQEDIKMLMLIHQRHDAWAAAAANLLIPAIGGIGSFMQSDAAGGVIGVLTGLTTFSFGFLLVFVTAFTIGLGGDPPSLADELPWAYYGFWSMLGAHVLFSTVRPFFWVSKCIDSPLPG